MKPFIRRTLIALMVISLIFAASAVAMASGDRSAGTTPSVAKIVLIHYGQATAARWTATDQVRDYKYTGIRWPDAEPVIRFSVDPANGWGLADSSISTAVDLATGAWHSANAKVTFVDEGTTTTAIDPGAFPDGKNTVSFRSISSQFPSAIAVTYSWYYTKTKRVFEVDTIFNDDLPWSVNPYGASFSGSYDVQNIATHEIGHWLVLGDLYKPRDSELTMYGYGAMGETKKDTLGLGDILGINRIYP